MATLPDLRLHPGARRVQKRPLALPVCFAAADGTCETLEGPVRYRRGDAILTGTQGERWPVERDQFLATYRPVPPTRAGADGLYRKLPAIAYALRLDAACEVPVGRPPGSLHGRPGDWLVQYPDGSYGIVQDAIFNETYAAAPERA